MYKKRHFMHFLKPLKMLKNPTKQYKKCNQPNFYRFNWLHLGGQGWIRLVAKS